MSNKSKAEDLAKKAVIKEQNLIKAKAKFELENAEFAKFLKKQSATQKQINDMWSEVKQSLVEAEYYDVIENDNFKISLSRVANFDTDVEILPEDYTETLKVAKKDKIKKHFELYGEWPEGASDKSYYRLNKRIKERS